MACDHCGSDWFRLETFDRYGHGAGDVAADASPFWFSRPEFLDPGVSGHMHCQVAFCLCGRPKIPRLGAVPSGSTAEAEIELFYKSAGRAQQQRLIKEPEFVIEAATARKASRSAVSELRARVQRAQEAIAKRLRRLRKRREMQRLLPMTARQPATSGKDVMVVAAQQRGILFRDARRAVDAVFNIWKEQLHNGNSIETPVGQIKIRPAWKDGKRTWKIHLRRKRFFDEGLSPMRLNRGRERIAEALKSKEITCPQCGGVHFYKAAVRQYLQGSSGSIGGELREAPGGAEYETLVCLCGRPHYPQKSYMSRSLEFKSFQESLNKALRSRDTAPLEKTFAEWAQRFADREQVAELERTIVQLEEAVRTLKKRPEGKTPDDSKGAA